MNSDSDHVDYVSLRDIARLTELDARRAKAGETRRADTPQSESVEDEHAVLKGFAQND